MSRKLSKAVRCLSLTVVLSAPAYAQTPAPDAPAAQAVQDQLGAPLPSISLAAAGVDMQPPTHADFTIGSMLSDTAPFHFMFASTTDDDNRTLPFASSRGATGYGPAFTFRIGAEYRRGTVAASASLVTTRGSMVPLYIRELAGTDAPVVVGELPNAAMSMAMKLRLLKDLRFGDGVNLTALGEASGDVAPPKSRQPSRSLSGALRFGF